MGTYFAWHLLQVPFYLLFCGDEQHLLYHFKNKKSLYLNCIQWTLDHLCVWNVRARAWNSSSQKKKCNYNLNVLSFILWFSTSLLPVFLMNLIELPEWQQRTVYYLPHQVINDFINKTDNKAVISLTVLWKMIPASYSIFQGLGFSVSALNPFNIFPDREKWKSILKPISIRIPKLLSQVSQYGPVSGNVAYPFWNETLSEATKMAEDSLSVNYFSPCVNSTLVLSCGRLFHPLVII